MDRIYTNRLHGQCRIHIEIAENEIADLLDDLTPGPDAFDATFRLIELLRDAHADFADAYRRDAAEAETSRT